MEHGDQEGIDAAIAAAAERTPGDVRAVVLGCTHYELVAERIRTAVRRPGLAPLVLSGSPGRSPRRHCAGSASSGPGGPAEGSLTVLLSGSEGGLSATALASRKAAISRRSAPPADSAAGRRLRPAAVRHGSNAPRARCARPEQWPSATRCPRCGT